MFCRIFKHQPPNLRSFVLNFLCTTGYDFKSVSLLRAHPVPCAGVIIDHGFDADNILN